MCNFYNDMIVGISSIYQSFILVAIESNFFTFQLELLYRRRASAASAAIAQQRQINAFSSTPTTPPKQNIPTSGLNQRPQAQVGPFQVQRPIQNSSSDSEKIQFDHLDHPPVSGTGKHQPPIPVRLPQRGPAMKRPDKPPPPPKRNPNTVSIYSSSDTVRLLNNGVDMPVPPPYSALSNNTRYYGNYDQGLLRHGRTDQLSIRNDSMKALKRRSWVQQNDAPEADIFRVLLEEQKKGKTHISFSDLHNETVPTISENVNAGMNGVQFRNSTVTSPTGFRPKPIIEDIRAPEPQFQQPPQAPTPEKIAAVSVTVSQKKEKPEVDSQASESFSKQLSSQKVEEPKVVLEAVTVADKKGSAVAKPRQPPPPAPELEEALMRELESHRISQPVEPTRTEVHKTEVVVQKPEAAVQKSSFESPEARIQKLIQGSEITPKTMQSPEVKLQSPEITVQKLRIQNPEIVEHHNIEVNKENEDICRSEISVESEEDDHSRHEKLIPGPSIIEDDSSASTSMDEDISSSSDVLPVVFDEFAPDENKPKPRSILKSPGKKKHNKRIVFDPFVLFLDGALEGQLDTVKENASKVSLPHFNIFLRLIFQIYVNSVF